MFRYLLLYALLGGVLVATASGSNKKFFYLRPYVDIGSTIKELNEIAKNRELEIEKSLNVIKIYCHTCNEQEMLSIFTKLSHKITTNEPSFVKGEPLNDGGITEGWRND